MSLQPVCRSRVGVLDLDAQRCQLVPQFVRSLVVAGLAFAFAGLQDEFDEVAGDGDLAVRLVIAEREAEQPAGAPCSRTDRDRRRGC